MGWFSYYSSYVGLLIAPSVLINAVNPLLKFCYDHNEWAFSNSWVASCSILKSKCNVNAQYKPTPSWKASCSILMLKCKRVRSPRQRSLWYSSLELRVAKQTTQLSAFFLTNSQYFSNISRILLEYFWNVSKIPQQARQLSKLLPLSCPVEGRQIPVMICERSAKVFWLLASPPPSHWQTKTVFGQIHS